MSPKKAESPTFTQRHAESISRLKLILIVVCLVAIPLSFWLTHEDLGSVSNRVTKIESPCRRYGSESRVCQRAFETAVHSINHRIACYIDHESGKPFKPSCLGVHLKIEIPVPGSTHRHGPTSSAPNGGDANSAPMGSSQPGRHEGGSDATDQPSHPHAPSVPHQSPPKVPTEHGGEAVPSPPASSSPTPSQPSSSPGSVTEGAGVEEPQAEAPQPVTTAAGGLVESVGHTVEGLGEAAGGTVEGVEAKTCELAKVLCGE